MLRRPPRSTRTYTLCPDTTLCRARRGRARAAAGGRAEECGGGLCRAARGIVRWTALYRTVAARRRSEEHTSELQSLMRISYAVFCLTKQPTLNSPMNTNQTQTIIPIYTNISIYQYYK